MRESQCQQKQSDGLSGGQLLRCDQVEVHSASAWSYRSLYKAPRGFNGTMAAWFRSQGWFWSRDTAAEDVRQQPYPGCDRWVNYYCHMYKPRAIKMEGDPSRSGEWLGGTARCQIPWRAKESDAGPARLPDPTENGSGRRLNLENRR